MITGRIGLVSMVLAFILAVVTGCTTPTPTPTPSPTSTSTPTPTATPRPSPTPTPQARFPLTITDSLGRQVTIDRPPQRIVAFDSAGVETLYAIGAGDLLVGTHTFVDYPPQVASVPRVGDAFNVNLERVAELQPDLFYTFFQSSIPELEALGIKVLYLESPQSLEETFQRMEMWGSIVGRVAEAQELVEGLRDRLGQLQRRLSQVQQGPRVFHDVGDRWTPGPDTFQGQLYTILKAQNIASDVQGWAQLSAEVVVERDPQVIIAPYPGGPEAVRGNPAFSGTSAVKAGRVHTIDPDLVDIPGPRIVQGLEELARLLYPELFTSARVLAGARVP